MSLRMRAISLSAMSIWLTACLLSCGGKNRALTIPRSSQGDVRLLSLGQELLDDKKWEDARSYFQQLLDSYPRSPVAGDARLGIADTYFKQKGPGNRVLSIAEYRDFLTFFPNHPRADYAQHQIAIGHYQQMRNADRDQEPTYKAITEFEKLIEFYRNSRYAQEDQLLLQECYERLSQSELNIGSFYLKQRKHCRAAIPRLQTVVKGFPSFTRMDEAEFLLGEALRLCKRPKEALPHYQKVIENFPDSEYHDEAQEHLATIQKSKKATP